MCKFKKLLSSYWFWCIMACLCPIFVCLKVFPDWIRLLFFSLQCLFFIIELICVFKSKF